MNCPPPPGHAGRRRRNCRDTRVRRARRCGGCCRAVRRATRPRATGSRAIRLPGGTPLSPAPSVPRCCQSPWRPRSGGQSCVRTGSAPAAGAPVCRIHGHGLPGTARCPEPSSARQAPFPAAPARRAGRLVSADHHQGSAVRADEAVFFPGSLEEPGRVPPVLLELAGGPRVLGQLTQDRQVVLAYRP